MRNETEVGKEDEEALEEPVEEAPARKKPRGEVVEERIYTIPLGRAFIVPRKRRAPKSIRFIRNFISRHMKADSIVISNEVNEKIWERGIEKPPRKIRVRATKDKEGVVAVYLAEGQ